MSTVSKQPVPPKNVTPTSHVGGDVGSAQYARPTAGGNATGDNVPAAPGIVPGPAVYRPNLAGNPPDPKAGK